MLPSRPSIRPALWLMLALALSGCGLGRRQSEHDCMARAMYFESNRSSREGMIAVGSVVMNRLRSGKYPRSVCGVVGQPRQFAPGVLTRPMKGRDVGLAQEAAAAVLRGERHPQIGNAMFFHQAGLHTGYDNMHYVLVAGGNAFYERT